MNKKKRYTFLFIPHSREGVRQINLSHRVLLFLSAVLTVCLILLVYFIIGFQTKRFQQKNIRSLNYENKIISTSLKHLQEDIDSITVWIDSLNQTSNALARFANLPGIDSKNNEPSVYITTTDKDAELIHYLEYLSAFLTLTEYHKNTMIKILDFCENNKERLNSIPSILPARGTITYIFGVRENPVARKKLLHAGIDIYNLPDTPIVATADGVIEKYKEEKYYGRRLCVDHGGGIKTYYSHLSSIPKNIRTGRKVKRGDIIGYMGDTGEWTQSVALHYQVERDGTFVDPSLYFFATPPELIQLAYK